MLVQSIVRGVLIPGLIAGVVLALAWRPWRREVGPGVPWGATLALMLGYPAGHAAIIGWPRFPPIEATQWLVYLCIGAGVLGLVGSRWKAPAARWAEKVVVAAGVPALVLRPLLEHSWSRLEGALWLAGLAVGIAVLWTALEALAARTPGWTLPLALLATAGASSAVLLISGSALVSQLAGVLAATLGAGLVATWLSPEHSMAGALPAIVALLAALWLSGHFYAEMPASSGLLLAAAPAAAWIGRAGLAHRLSPWNSALLTALAVLILLGAALGIALRSGSDLAF